jgi:hypothetical protein
MREKSIYLLFSVYVRRREDLINNALASSFTSWLKANIDFGRDSRESLKKFPFWKIAQNQTNHSNEFSFSTARWRALQLIRCENHSKNTTRKTFTRTHHPPSQFRLIEKKVCLKFSFCVFPVWKEKLLGDSFTLLYSALFYI